MSDTTDLAISAWTDLTNFLNQEFHKPDTEALACVLSACRAHYGDDDPVWLFIIGPSGSGKTSIAANCAGVLPRAHIEGDINLQAMMNCQRGGESASILGPEAQGGYGDSFILVFKDFTSILSQKDDDQKRLIGLFREVYDGSYVRKTAARKAEWHGKATVIACVTPAIERAWAVHRSLGERFLQVRWPNGDAMKIAKRAREQRGREKLIAEEMRRLTKEIFKLSLDTHQTPALTEAQGQRIDALASMIALLRTHVTRDSHGDRGVIEVSASEEPSRLAKCLETLVCHHARLHGREDIDESDMRIAVRVGFDSIPHNRSRVVNSIPYNASMPIADVRRLTSMIRSTIIWTADELIAMEVLEQTGCVELSEISYNFSPKFAEMWRNSIPPPE